MNAMKLSKHLMIGFAIILAMGCNQKMVKPTKPILVIIPEKSGGICLDKQNATELGNYIIELEKGYY